MALLCTHVLPLSPSLPARQRVSRTQARAAVMGGVSARRSGKSGFAWSATCSLVIGRDACVHDSELDEKERWRGGTDIGRAGWHWEHVFASVLKRNLPIT